MPDDPREEVRRLEDKMLIANFNELADTVLGTRQSALRGGGRRDDGLVHTIAEIERDVHSILKTNGTRRLTTPQRVGAVLVFAFLVWREVQPFI